MSILVKYFFSVFAKNDLVKYRKCYDFFKDFTFRNVADALSALPTCINI